jgi:phosphoribosylformylglycinamidine synthase
MALAPNINPLIAGYYCAWVNIKNVNEKNCAYNYFYKKNEIIQIPVAHGEGRFTTKNKSLIKKLMKNKQISFQYCDKEGRIINKFPINPNGALYNIAAISNKKGNIMAIMPHPERASFNWQLPNTIKKDNKKTSGIRIFESMKRYIKENR